MRPEGVITSWLSMPWALEPRVFDVGLQRLLSVEISPRQAVKFQQFAEANVVRLEPEADFLSPGRDDPSVDDRRRMHGYYVLGGSSVGVLGISGLLMKEVPFCFEFMSGEKAVSTERLRMSIDAMLDDDAIDRIVLEIDSPGGQVRGTQELGDTIMLASEQKPITAAIRDLGASGAYWLASQAKEVTANHTAMIGSIGVYVVVDDFSKMFEELGIKTHVISSGGVKGAGVEGAPVSDEAIQVWREGVVALKDLFVEAIANGREMSVAAVQDLAIGRCWLAKEALDKGLIDRVENFDETLERVSEE